MTAKEIERGLKRLEELADFLEKKVPTKNFDMSEWGSISNDDVISSEEFRRALRRHECGTAACALGWATVLFPKLLRFRILDPHTQGAELTFCPVLRDDPGVEVTEAAQAVFALTNDEAHYLFLPGSLTLRHITIARQVRRMRLFVRKRRQGYTIEIRKQHIASLVWRYRAVWIKSPEANMPISPIT